MRKVPRSRMKVCKAAVSRACVHGRTESVFEFVLGKDYAREHPRCWSKNAHTIRIKFGKQITPSI